MEQQYLDILKQIHETGNKRTTRNGITSAVFAPQLRHDLRTGFPLLTTKLVPSKLVMGELIWFLEAGKNSEIPYRMSNVRFREILDYPADKHTIWSHDQEKPAYITSLPML